MGMRSTFVDQDITITDENKLLGEILLLKSQGIDDYGLVDKDNIEIIDFSKWDDHKLQGYWYDNTINVLKAIAKYISGEAEFWYEEGYGFKLEFNSDGNVELRCQENEWAIHTVNLMED